MTQTHNVGMSRGTVSIFPSVMENMKTLKPVKSNSGVGSTSKNVNVKYVLTNSQMLNSLMLRHHSNGSI